MTARDPKTGRFIAAPKPPRPQREPIWEDGWYDRGGVLPARDQRHLVHHRPPAPAPRRTWPRVVAVVIAVLLAIAYLVWLGTR